MAVYGYARVSTLRQADDGDSLVTQERTLEGYAMMHGLTVDEIFIERGISGSRPFAERPEGARVVERLKPGDVVVTACIDRAFRSALDALDVLNRFKAEGVALHIVDLGGDVAGDGIGKLTFTILSAVAEAERDRISDRIKEAKAEGRRAGRFLGGQRPFGFKVVAGDLVPIPKEQDAIAWAVQLRAKGWSYRRIATALSAEGFGLSHMVVKRVVGESTS